jgi:ABC-type antimicrobial peptide transport system permease subunit
MPIYDLGQEAGQPFMVLPLMSGGDVEGLVKKAPERRIPLERAALSYLGLGDRAPAAEWGAMLNDGRPYFRSQPWLMALPGLCICLVALAANLLGDLLRDLLDPRSR